MERIDHREAFTDGKFMDKDLKEWPWASGFPSQLLGLPLVEQQVQRGMHPGIWPFAQRVSSDSTTNIGRSPQSQENGTPRMAPWIEKSG